MNKALAELNALCLINAQDVITRLYADSDEDIDMAITALEKQIELLQIIADIKKDFNKDDTYSVSLVLELLESVQIGGKNE